MIHVTCRLSASFGTLRSEIEYGLPFLTGATLVGKKVCVKPPASALNMTLPAFAAERRRLQQISIDSWYAAPPGAQQQTRRTPLLLPVGSTDGRKNKRTDP